jgi:hypothetical protein
MVAKTLIVGLGGIGSEITARLAAKIPDELRERINLVIIDTDVNTLEPLARKSHGGFTAIQISTKNTVGTYLYKDEYTCNNSFPLNKVLYDKVLTEGAGQVRAISHLAFIDAMMRKEFRALDDAITDLYKIEHEAHEQALRVIIVSSLAGGTGSGLILPVSLYIRNFIRTKMNMPGNITRGFFILPEVIFGKVSDEKNRERFRTNAYAVLRELNAFIMKADGNLPERYKDSVKLMFPMDDAGNMEEYNVLPLDYAFMFDAQNINGERLNTAEQYYDHAATCIYAQAIGPMNAIGNAQEDNMIQSLVEGKSKNRYCGAGASELWYPSRHILDYIALKWAAQTVSNHWTVFDKMFDDQKKEQNKQLKRGINIAPITREEKYIESVDSAASKQDPFALCVRNANFRFDKHGITERGNRWDEYIQVIRDYVVEQATRGQEDADASRKNAQSYIEKSRGKKASPETLKSAYEHLRTYKELVARISVKIGNNAAYMLFKSEVGDDKTRLEKYLLDGQQAFMHPNAVRYFLHNLSSKLKKDLEEIKAENQKNNEGFEAFFGPAMAKKVSEAAIAAKNANLLSRLFGGHTARIRHLARQMSGQLAVLEAYRTAAPHAVVLEAAVDYISQLCRSFEQFFSTFDANVAELNRRIEIEEDKYALRKGNTVRYVCASKNCLDKFYAQMEFTGDYISIPGDLCRQIYEKVKAFRLADNIDPASFFHNIFFEHIIGHFRETVSIEHGALIDMDTIRALEAEAEFEEGLREPHKVEAYVERVIAETKALSLPFINRPVAESFKMQEACAYNENLQLPDNPVRAALLERTLKSSGGVPSRDDEISKERVIFYSAIYGLFPYDLRKFAPPRQGETLAQPAGEYYTAYQAMIKRIKIDSKSDDKDAVTPHIHKLWHLIAKLPELNEDIQEGREREIYRALALGLLYERIRCVEVPNTNRARGRAADGKAAGAMGSKYRYEFWRTNSRFPTQLQCLDQSPCDSFYKLHEALMSNPSVVEMIDDAVAYEADKGHTRNITFENSAVMRGLNRLSLPEFMGDTNRVSIFGIAMAIKAMAPPELFVPEQDALLLDVILEVLLEQLSTLCHKHERDEKFVALVKEHYELAKDSLGMVMQRYPSALDGYFDSVLQAVIVFMNNNEFYDAADEFDEIRRNAKRSGGETVGTAANAAS